MLLKWVPMLAIWLYLLTTEYPTIKFILSWFFIMYFFVDECIVNYRAKVFGKDDLKVWLIKVSSLINSPRRATGLNRR